MNPDTRGSSQTDWLQAGEILMILVALLGAQGHDTSRIQKVPQRWDWRSPLVCGGDEWSG